MSGGERCDGSERVLPGGRRGEPVTCPECGREDLHVQISPFGLHNPVIPRHNQPVVIQ